MALFHVATLQPSKAELIAEWAPRQSWYPDAAPPPVVIGAFRFDDPEGRVGMEIHIVRAGDKLSDGSIRSITADSMVILQQVNDPLSLQKEQEVRKLLRQTEGK